MDKKLLLPQAFEEAARQLNMSPAIISGNHVFLTGMTGSGLDGFMPSNPEEQFHNIFNKILQILEAGDLDLQSVVEMTSYHVGLEDHFDIFDSVRLDNFNPPYPAWTAVEVAGLRRKGALAEVRVIAVLG